MCIFKKKKKDIELAKATVSHLAYATYRSSELYKHIVSITFFLNDA